MLTQRQREALVYINERIRESGVAPAYTEIAAALGIVSKGRVNVIVEALDYHGYIRRLPGRARAMEVIRMPEDYRPAAIASTATPVKAGRIPIVSKVETNLPASLQVITGSISLPGTMDGDFAIEVRGDSMVDAGILPSDLVVLKRRASLMQGDVVLAIIDNEEATLRRYRLRGAAVALEAANPAYETRILAANRVTVQARMTGLIRRY